MRSNLVGILLMVLLSCSGCAAVLIGAGVAGGIAISEDTAKLEVDTSFNRAWSVTHRVIKDMGAISLSDKNAGTIEAIVQESKIEAKVVPVTSKTVRIEIKSRKNLLPNMDLAMMIVNKINGQF